MGCAKGDVSFSLGLVVVILATFMASSSVALTDFRDVFALNSLYLSLNTPPLTGWMILGGDPCGDQWQGVSCVFSNVTSLTLSGLNLGGMLNDDLGGLASILEIDLSYNHIGGTIPSNLPPTLKRLSLAGNQITGNIPVGLSSLSQLLFLFLNNNLLSGDIPDAFQQLTSLTSLDLSGNNLTGQLPPSFANLQSVSSLHLEKNKLTGLLDVLQDLPLNDLDVEDNLFWGPIPPKLLSILTFRRDNNPFNTTVIPPPPLPAALPPSIAISPSPAQAPAKQANRSPAPRSEIPKSETKKKFSTKRISWIAISVVLMVIMLGMCILVLVCCKRRQVKEDIEKHDMDLCKGHKKKPTSKSLLHPFNQEENIPKESVVKSQNQCGPDKRRLGITTKRQDESNINVKRVAAFSRNKTDHSMDMAGADVNIASLQTLPRENVITHPVEPGAYIHTSSTRNPNSSCSARVFTIAALQQYTHSFSEENFVGEGTQGSVYRAELPDGKLLAVKKLNNTASMQQTDEEFLQLVSSISKIRHANVVELVGYCNEHGQRLLVYEYFESGTLHNALHMDGEIHKKLSWNTRVRLALGAARALQYLHEFCQPLIVHCNFKSSNILIDDKLAAHVSDCGLTPLISSASQLSGHHVGSQGYGAPELEMGSYTCKSDVYSFGVVMLELLTGRKAFDRSRSRGEQSLVRWAIPQLHDIDALSRMVDPSLKGAYPVKSLSRFVDIISRCIQWEAEFRPPMSEVVQDLLHVI